MTIGKRLGKALARRVGFDITAVSWTIDGRRRRLLENVDVLADVGANVGQYARATRRAGWAGKIISYEPLSTPYKALDAAAAADPAWTAVRTAVGREAGQLSINVSENDVFSSLLAPLDRGARVYGRMAVVGSEVIPVDTLDHLLADELDAGRRIGVKVDVQGFERGVLEGAARTLETAAFWEMELSPAPLYEGQMLMIEALERLAAAGLVLTGVENIFTDVATGRSLQFNGLFLREPT